ncbi:hypothetical protein EON80_18085 [bacterium]|nr:MAG: hypothetical protein EON80_18085 [bacterium]
MKYPVSPFVLALTALSISGFGSIKNGVAQQQTGISMERGGTTTHTIRVKNVAPSVLAWWLDPANNQEPRMFEAARLAAEDILPVGPLEKNPAKPLGDYKLPAGVERIVAIDPQNALMVFGTEAGFSEFEKVVASLDKPLKSIEVEVKFLVISDAQVKQLDLKNFSKNSEKDPYSWAILTPDSELEQIQKTTPTGFVRSSTIENMIRKSKAQIITAPRVTAIDNLTASLRSETVRPFILGPQEGIPVYTEPNTQPLLFWSSALGITVRPTINVDNTISLNFTPGLTIKLQVPAKGDLKATLNSQNDLNTVWQRQLGGIVNLSNIQSGQTVAVTGFKTDSLLPRSPTDKSKPGNVLLLVKPHIIRRAGDPDPTIVPTSYSLH